MSTSDHVRTELPRCFRLLLSRALLTVRTRLSIATTLLYFSIARKILTEAGT